MSNTKLRESTKTLVLGAILTALVIILQFMGTANILGPFSSAVALIPIVIGAVLCGLPIAAWLGFVFGLVVIISGGAMPFIGIDFVGTVITVIVKGITCAVVAGLVYKWLKKYNKYLAVIVASISCPIVNTGIFILGCQLFFIDNMGEFVRALTEMGITVTDTGIELFIGLAMANFLFELISNAVLSPVIVRLLNIRKKA